MPTRPPAPVRFSTITGCPSDSESFCATMRVLRSPQPPAATGTISRTGREGKVSAAAGGAETSVSASAVMPPHAMGIRTFMKPLRSIEADHGLHLEVLLEPEHAHLAAVAGLLVAAHGRHVVARRAV